MAYKDTTTLLCLVLCLGQRIQAQEGDFPIPVLSAEPGSVIPCNASVKIRCRGTPESYLYRLVILRNSTYTEVDKKLGISKEAEFVFSRVDANTAGRYRCLYRKQFSWSEHSEALELVVTDSVNQDYTAGNLIRMGVAGLVLVAFLAILGEHWHSHRVPHKEGWPHLAEPSWRKQKCQTEWTLGQTTSGHL
uniref:Fc alpha receptor n=1 Tax=Prolemur simus TaxID=1328070 RepID=A0A8C8Z0N2_PROSS